MVSYVWCVALRESVMIWMCASCWDLTYWNEIVALKCHLSFHVVFPSDSLKRNPQWHLRGVHSLCKRLPFAHSSLSRLSVSVGRSKNLRPLRWLLWEVHSPGSQRPTPSGPLRATHRPNPYIYPDDRSPGTFDNSDLLDPVVFRQCDGGAFNSIL